MSEPFTFASYDQTITPVTNGSVRSYGHGAAENYASGSLIIPHSIKQFTTAGRMHCLQACQRIISMGLQAVFLSRRRCESQKRKQCNTSQTRESTRNRPSRQRKQETNRYHSMLNSLFPCGYKILFYFSLPDLLLAQDDSKDLCMLSKVFRLSHSKYPTAGDGSRYRHMFSLLLVLYSIAYIAHELCFCTSKSSLY